MSTQQEVIKNFMASLDKTTLSGTAALDEAIKNCSNFNGIQDAINHLVSDCSVASSSSDFLINKCGIILDNDDTGAITGSDAGGSKVKNAEDIVNETKTFDRNFNKNSFTIKNYNITFQLEKEFDTLTDKQKHIWQGLYTFWVEESLKLIKESYGYSFADADATVNKITLEFHTSETLSVMGQVTARSKNGKATEISMLINVERVDNMSEDDVSGKLWRGYYFDRMIAHELTHAIMRAKIDNYSKLPRFFREGIAELTHGIDDKRRNLIQSLSNDPENLKKYLNLDSEDLGSNSEGYAAGYMLLRYLAKQAANDIDSKVIYGTSGADNISNTIASATIYGYAGDDTINNNWVKATNVKIFGGAGKDVIYNSGSGATIDGGANDDTIDSGYIQSSLTSIFAGDGDDVIEIAGTKSTVNGGSGLDIIKAYRQASLSSIFGDAGNDGIINYASKVTINGGAGNDYISLSGSSQLITYSNGDGNDTVYGYKSSDTISIGGGSSYSTTKSGSDMKINVGSGSILVKGVANSTVNIYPPSTISPDPIVIENYTKNKTVNGTTSNDTIENYAGGVKIFGKDGNDSIYSGVEKDYTVKSTWGNVTIDAGAGNDSIYNDDPNVSINGGVGNDSINSKYSRVTITGGKGNDTINKDSSYGNNLIQYKNGDGNDIINGITSTDTIQISGSKYTSTTSGQNVILTVGSGKITLKGAKSTNFKISGTYGSEISTSTSTTLTLTNSDSNSINADSKVLTIDASSRTKAIKIFGNSKANKIFGSSKNDTIYGGNGADSINGGSGNDKLFGDAGNDTLIGGKGNDTLTGGNGKDIFVYASGDGNDVIADYSSSDKIQISGEYSTLTSGDDVIIKVGTGKITVKDAIDETLNITKINNYEERWFMDNSECRIHNDELESILIEKNNLIVDDLNFNDQFDSQNKITSLTYNQQKKK